MMLIRHGYEVHRSPNGVDALYQATQHKPDLILLDLMMPELDGFGVLEAMREREATREIPVIVLSGMDKARAAVETPGGADVAAADRAGRSPRCDADAGIAQGVGDCGPVRHTVSIVSPSCRLFVDLDEQYPPVSACELRQQRQPLQR